MPALQVRDLPQDIYDQLVASSKRDHRSIAQQTTHILEQHFKLLEGGDEISPKAQKAPLTGWFDVQSYGARLLPAHPYETPDERRERKLKMLLDTRKLPRLWEREGFIPPDQVISQMREERDCQHDEAMDMSGQEDDGL